MLGAAGAGPTVEGVRVTRLGFGFKFPLGFALQSRSMRLRSFEPGFALQSKSMHLRSFEPGDEKWDRDLLASFSRVDLGRSHGKGSRDANLTRLI